VIILFRLVLRAGDRLTSTTKTGRGPNGPLGHWHSRHLLFFVEAALSVHSILPVHAVCENGTLSVLNHVVHTVACWYRSRSNQTLCALTTTPDKNCAIELHGQVYWSGTKRGFSKKDRSSRLAERSGGHAPCMLDFMFAQKLLKLTIRVPIPEL
jgi:hypothetical protein